MIRWTLVLLLLLSLTGCALSPQPEATRPEPAPTATLLAEFGVSPAPTDWPAYRAESVGYTLRHPPEWQVDEVGLEQPNREVIFNPHNAEDFKVYLSVAVDTRPIENIQQVYRENTPDAVRSETSFAGHPAVQYSYPYGRVEIFIPRASDVLLVLTDFSSNSRVRQALSSFQITERSEP